MHTRVFEHNLCRLAPFDRSFPDQSFKIHRQKRPYFILLVNQERVTVQGRSLQRNERERKLNILLSVQLYIQQSRRNSSLYHYVCMIYKFVYTIRYILQLFCPRFLTYVQNNFVSFICSFCYNSESLDSFISLQETTKVRQIYGLLGRNASCKITEQMNVFSLERTVHLKYCLVTKDDQFYNSCLIRDFDTVTQFFNFLEFTQTLY